MDGIRDILISQQGLSDQSNHHEFCRLLARLKGNYQLNQIISVEGYVEWLNSIAIFTINSFQLWEWSPNSVYYLLTFWSRLVVSMNYLKKEMVSQFDSFAPKILKTYVSSRMASIDRGIESDNQDIIDEDEEQLIEQLEALPHLARNKYASTKEYLITLFDNLAQSFRMCIEMGNTSSKEFKMVEGKLTLLVYTIGSIVGGRQLAHKNSEEEDIYDGELASRVFELMRLHDASLFKNRRHFYQSQVGDFYFGFHQSFPQSIHR
eukprot:TRINITY_DN14835_c0_g1_i1.p1 TRINITY_DN14835_c0_g1~~TRINITY_DN14835_c0_g1_i1.p1  ORF type:complete len:263 (+),score=54.88 TRINITY_DN14835_c0_g1_i1:376-1164(+)